MENLDLGTQPDGELHMKMATSIANKHGWAKIHKLSKKLWISPKKLGLDPPKHLEPETDADL